jgi:outer membrane protein assembly factor BamB
VGNLNFAKMRSTPAALRDASGSWRLFVTGSTKTAVRSEANLPPSLVRLRVATRTGAPAWLEVDGQASAVAMLNPGSPVLTSNGADHAVVWVLDQNAQRTDSLLSPTVQRPVLYAFDARTLELLWRSARDELDLAGKYGTVTVARGVVYVGTGRLQAFGLRP